MNPVLRTTLWVGLGLALAATALALMLLWLLFGAVQVASTSVSTASRWSCPNGRRSGANGPRPWVPALRCSVRCCWPWRYP